MKERALSTSKNVFTKVQLLLKVASEYGAKRISVHILADGRDVIDGTGVGFVETLECDLAKLCEKSIDPQIAFGFGRMYVTMDRYKRDKFAENTPQKAKLESRSPPSMAKRLWHMVRVVYYMLRKGVSKRKLMMGLHLLKRGKLARKAFGNIITFHHGDAAAFSRRSNMPFYDSKEVEFSCSHTPSYANYFTAKRKNRRHSRRDDYDSYHVNAIAKAFEILNAGEASNAESAASVLPMPSPMLGFGRSPMVPQLRVTDSPFPIQEEEKVVDAGRIDKEADEFIKRFYEQLRRQHLASA